MMKRFTTVELLIIATLATLVATVICYSLPHAPDAVRQLLSGQFIGYSSALLVALKTDGPQNPAA